MKPELKVGIQQTIQTGALINLSCLAYKEDLLQGRGLLAGLLIQAVCLYNLLYKVYCILYKVEREVGLKGFEPVPGFNIRLESLHQGQKIRNKRGRSQQPMDTAETCSETSASYAQNHAAPKPTD